MWIFQIFYNTVSLSFSFCVLWYVFFLLLCYQFIRAIVSAQRALSDLFTSCQFVMLLSIFYEQLNDDDEYGYACLTFYVRLRQCGTCCFTFTNDFVALQWVLNWPVAYPRDAMLARYSYRPIRLSLCLLQAGIVSK